MLGLKTLAKTEAGNVTKFFIEEYGGALTVASRLYNGLEKLDTFKENKIFSNINKTISVATIVYDMYNRYQRYKEYNAKPTRSISDDRRDFIYPLIGAESSNRINSYNVRMQKYTLDYLINNLHAFSDMIIGYYDLESMKKIEYVTVSEFFPPNLCVAVKFDGHIYLIDIERSIKKENTIKQVYCKNGCNVQDIQKLLAKFDVMYLEGIGYDKNIIKYDGQEPLVVPRSEPLDVELEAIDIPTFKQEVSAILENGDRHGYLLVGNPGTGKSTVLLKLESELVDYPIVYTTAKNFDCAESIERFNNFISVMDKCVVFIEDMDAMDLSRKCEKVSELLTLLDGVRRDNSVVFIATINDASLVTESIARTGRFDEVIEIHEPKKNSIIHSIIKYNWVKYNGSADGFPCSPNDISFLTYFRMKRHQLTQSDYGAISQKIHIKGKKVSNKTLIDTMKEIVKSKNTFKKYKDMHKDDNK